MTSITAFYHKYCRWYVELKVEYSLYLLKYFFLCLVCVYQLWITPSHCPLKATLSIYYQVIATSIWYHFCYHILFITFHIFLKMSNWTYTWNCRWYVELEPYSSGSIFQWHPVLRIYPISSSTFLNWTIVRHIELFGFSFDKMVLILAHNLTSFF